MQSSGVFSCSEGRQEAPSNQEEKRTPAACRADSLAAARPVRGTHPRPQCWFDNGPQGWMRTGATCQKGRENGSGASAIMFRASMDTGWYIGSRKSTCRQGCCHHAPRTSNTCSCGPTEPGCWLSTPVRDRQRAAASCVESVQEGPSVVLWDISTTWALVADAEGNLSTALTSRKDVLSVLPERAPDGAGLVVLASAGRSVLPPNASHGLLERMM